MDNLNLIIYGQHSLIYIVLLIGEITTGFLILILIHTTILLYIKYLLVQIDLGVKGISDTQQGKKMKAIPYQM